ncbi:MAG: DUF6155 family protein [Muribaculaceae bacterium]|nr:DUF6155 family protein [Muribaculaceae bacterium]
MSKAALKKELITFTGPQLVEVILNAYDSSKEAKAYFEFFLNPDADALLEKKIDIIAKELTRAKWGLSKARISHIRKEIKEFEAFGVGPEKTSELMLAALRMLVGQYRHLNYPAPLLKGTFKLTHDYIAHADAAAMLAPALEQVRLIVDDKNLGTASLRENIRRVMTHTIEELAAKR